MTSVSIDRRVPGRADRARRRDRLLAAGRRPLARGARPRPRRARRRSCARWQTAGRAVVFSGTTVAIGLLAMVVLPLPFLRSIGYARHADPAGQRGRRDDAAAGRAVEGRAAARLAARAHAMTRQAAPGPLGPARRPPPLGGRRRCRGSCSRRSCSPRRRSSRARPTSTRSPSRATPASGLLALERSGIGAGRARADRDAGAGRAAPRTAASAVAAVARRPRRRRARGPAWRRAGLRSSTRFPSPTARPGRPRHDRRACGRRPRCRRRRPRRRDRRRRTRTSSRRSTAASR